MMEQRTEMLKNMRLGKVVQPQTIVDKSHEAAQDVKDVKGWICSNYWVPYVCIVMETFAVY